MAACVFESECLSLYFPHWQNKSSEHINATTVNQYRHLANSKDSALRAMLCIHIIHVRTIVHMSECVHIILHTTKTHINKTF